MTDNITVIQEIYAAFGRGDLDAILAAVADEPDWGFDVPEHVPGAKAVPFLHHLTSRSDVAETYFGSVAREMEWHAFVPRSFFGSGDEVMTLIDVDFTVRSTGRRVQAQEVHHFTLADGKIVRYRPFLDTATFIEAFGG
jgi:ketosteroid isomerase-like protein